MRFKVDSQIRRDSFCELCWGILEKWTVWQEILLGGGIVLFSTMFLAGIFYTRLCWLPYSVGAAIGVLYFAIVLPRILAVRAMDPFLWKRRSYHAVFFEKTLHYVDLQRNTETCIPYTALTRCKETKRYFILFGKEATHFFVVSKNGFQQGNSEEFRSFLGQLFRTENGFAS